jgi:hypothetical protein
MATLCYYLRRVVAIALGLALTGYSAWASWSHHHDLIGPLAAISAAGMLIFAECALRDRHWVHFVGLGALGLAAAVISGSVVLERVSYTQEARAHAARSANLPRSEAQKALDEAKSALTAAETAARAECSSGRGPKCEGLEKREDAARKRVEDARSKLVGLGAETVVNPTAGVLGAHAETFRLATLLGLPLWLELAAPSCSPTASRRRPARSPRRRRRRSGARQSGGLGNPQRHQTRRQLHVRPSSWWPPTTRSSHNPAPKRCEAGVFSCAEGVRCLSSLRARGVTLSPCARAQGDQVRPAGARGDPIEHLTRGAAGRCRERRAASDNRARSAINQHPPADRSTRGLLLPAKQQEAAPLRLASAERPASRARGGHPPTRS